METINPTLKTRQNETKKILTNIKMAIADLLNTNTGEEDSYDKSFKKKMEKVHKLNEKSEKNSHPDRSRMNATFDI